MVVIHSAQDKARGASDLSQRVPNWLVWAYGFITVFNLLAAVIRLAVGEQAGWAFVRAVTYVAALGFVLWCRRKMAR